MFVLFQNEDVVDAEFSLSSKSMAREAPSSGHYSDLEHIRWRENLVKSLDSFIFDYQFDGKKNLWCKVRTLLVINL